jgi:hypothetical protein
MTTTIDFITALFYEVDEQMGAIPKHPEAHLWPSEVVTLGLLHALKGVGNRPFYRWLTRDYRALFPRLPERTRLFRLFTTHQDWTQVFLAAPTVLGVIDTYGIELLHPIPTVSLDIISWVASSCEYYRGQIEQHAAQEFAVHVATQRGLAKRRQHRHPPRAQPVAPLRERHCRRPRLTPRGVAPLSTLSRSGTTRWRTREKKRSNRLTMPRDAMPASPIFASWQWLPPTGYSLEAIDMTVHERNH